MNIKCIGRSTELLRECREPGLNQRPPDLQSGALPTELSRPKALYFIVINNFAELSKRIFIYILTFAEQ